MQKNEIGEFLDDLFWRMKMQLGGVIESRWFYTADGCPGCGKAIKGMKWKGKDALSINTFIYREQKVLIGYLLCGKCARYVHKASETDQNTKTELHETIEKNLKQDFLKKTGH